VPVSDTECRVSLKTTGAAVQSSHVPCSTLLVLFRGILGGNRDRHLPLDGDGGAVELELSQGSCLAWAEPEQRFEGAVGGCGGAQSELRSAV
jgi:hypothetical protein